MAHRKLDRVAGTTTSVGTGALTLGSTAVEGYSRFQDVLNDGDTAYVMIVDRATKAREGALVTYSGGALTRTTTLSSSTGGRIDFSAGTKDMFIYDPASKAVVVAPDDSVSLPGALSILGALAIAGAALFSGPVTFDDALSGSSATFSGTVTADAVLGKTGTLASNFNATAYGVSAVSADNATTLQAAADAAYDAGGGDVSLPSGVLDLSGYVQRSYVTLVGANDGSTVLRLKSGTNADIIKGDGFDALTGTNSAGGIHSWGLRNLTIDGNKANNLTGGAGVRVYGYGFKIENVAIKDCRDWGWISEYEAGFSVPLPNSMEAHVVNLKVHDCEGGGIDWNGPHDSSVYAAIAYRNNGIGIRAGANAGGTVFTSGHSWGPPQTYAWVVIPFNVQLNGCIGETASVNNLLLLGNSAVVKGGMFYNSGTYQPANGSIQIGNASYPGTSHVTIDTTMQGVTTNAINFYSPAANSTIKVRSYQTTGTLYTGTPAATAHLEIYSHGGADNDLFQFPGNLFARPRTGNAYLSLKDGSGTGAWLLTAQADGVWALYDQTNNLTPVKVGRLAPTNSLTLAGTTGYVGIGKSGAAVPLDVVGAGVFTGDIHAGASSALGFTGRSQFQSAADGNITVSNAAVTDFGLFRFGGTTSPFPALKRSGANLQLRLADDSGYTGLTGDTLTAARTSAGGLRLDAAAGTIRTVRWLTAGVARFDIGINATAEGGANAGADPYCQAFDDSGNSLGFPWVITRSNLNVTFGNNIFSAGRAHIYNGTAIPAGGTAGAGYKFSSATNFGMFFGSGAPTLSAAQGSLYVRSDGPPQYNNNGSTGYTELMGAVAVNSVSPTSPNRTISVSIGGTTYYVAAKTTND